MELTSRPTPHPQVAARSVDGSAVIVLADSGEVVVPNAVGTRIWELCDGGRTVRQIAEGIAAEFDVTFERALQDVEDFLGQLTQIKAIDLSAEE
jgi:hypothetical protein